MNIINLKYFFYLKQKKTIKKKNLFMNYNTKRCNIT